MSQPESILQFGTGMLMRSIVANAVDAANLAGHFDGRIVVVQSTPHGVAAAINRQHGEFTLVEQGIDGDAPVQRRRQIRSYSRALIADTEWPAILAVAIRPDLRVIISNVTEAGFRLDADQPASSFPGRLTDLLHARFTALPDAPVLFVIPTELVPDNGPRLAEMVDVVARRLDDANEFISWMARRVKFCSSLVDRITTIAPTEAERNELTTITELHWLWAIEGDPVALRAAFSVDAASPGSVIFAADISRYRERKLRLLNGAHTAIAPMAMMAGCRTVREAVAHAAVRPLLGRILFEEIAPSTSLVAEDAASYAQSVIDRFANPWLDHEWQVILTNQIAKLRLRVVPSIVSFNGKFAKIPDGLAWALAASLRYARTVGPAEGWWRGVSYPIVDVDGALIDAHWRRVDPAAARAAVDEATLVRFAGNVLGDAAIWGRDLGAMPGMVDAVSRALVGME